MGSCSRKSQSRALTDNKMEIGNMSRRYTYGGKDLQLPDESSDYLTMTIDSSKVKNCYENNQRLNLEKDSSIRSWLLNAHNCDWKWKNHRESEKMMQDIQEPTIHGNNTDRDRYLDVEEFSSKDEENNNPETKRGIRINERRMSFNSGMVECISNSLPNTIPTILTSDHSQECNASLGNGGKDLGASTPSQKSSNLLTATSCASLECKSRSHSPVARFLPRLLRNSFSKIRDSIPVRSKSVDLLKSNSEIDDSELDTSSSDIISPIDEEIVNESMKKGLPIIPFAYPSFTLVNKTVEDTKTLLRENSQKDLKHSFKTATNLEDNFELSGKSRRHYSFSEFITSSSLKSQEYVRHKPGQSKVSNESSYVEMSSQPQRKSVDEDHYMIMDRPSSKRDKKDSCDDTIFDLETPSKEEKLPNIGDSNLSHKYPFRTTSVFGRHTEMSGEGVDFIGVEERRRYKKGNKNRGDYVFLDLGKNKDLHGTNRRRTWKSLSFNNKK